MLDIEKLLNISKDNLNLIELEVFHLIKKEIIKREQNSNTNLYPKCLICGIIKDLIIVKEDLILEHKKAHRPDLEVVESNRVKVLKKVLENFNRGQ